MRLWLKRNWAQCGLWICVAFIGIGAPVYAAMNKPAHVTWVQVFDESASAKKPANDGHREGVSNDEAFGRQLDIITNFYQTIINWLVFLLATITALAFYTIRATSRQEAERIAREVIESEDFRSRVVAKVSAEVEIQIGDITRLVEELQQMYEALDDIVGAKERGEDDGDRKTQASDGSSEPGDPG